MSGAIAAIAAYNGKGTQGYSTTDKYIPGVKSVFWNEYDTDIHYVNGSCFCSIPSISDQSSSQETNPDTKTVTTFIVDNDIDAINNLTLGIKTYNQKTTILDSSLHASTPPDEAEVRRVTTDIFGRIMYIDYIDILVGNVIICSITSTDLLVQYRKGLSEVTSVANGEYGEKQDTYLKILLPIFDFLKKECNYSFLNVCAPHQDVRINVYTNNKINNTTKNGNINVTNLTYELYANKIVMTDSERTFLRSLKLPKRLSMYQSNDISTIESKKSIEINCDYFNLNAKNIYIIILSKAYSLESVQGTPEVQDKVKTLIDQFPHAFKFELFLNSINYSGQIESGMLIVEDRLESSATTDLINNNSNDSIAYLEPLLHPLYRYSFSETSNYSFTNEALVPLGKYDSIRIKLTLNDQESDNTFKDLFEKISIVCEGNCTALYQNGSVRFNNY